ncbi:MAG: hypothetical protein WBA17_07440 [Saprospiraceae bacterium]
MPTFAKAFFLLLLTFLLGCATPKPPVYNTQAVTQPTPFAPGVISTEANSEFDITFTPDGREAYFTRRAPGEKQHIYRTTLAGGRWGVPTRCSFSTDRDETPSISADGKLLFFGSERPLPGRPNEGNFDMNIWKVRRQGDGWFEPTPLPAPLNEVQVTGEEWPSSNNNFLSPVGEDRYYYTTMVRGTKSIQLYETTYRQGIFSEPTKITGLFDDPKYWVYSAVVSPDGKYLLFNSSGAPGGSGGEDLFVARRTTIGWSKARALGAPVNSKDEEGSPRFSRDGRYFFFSRAESLGNYEYGEWSIYYLETAHLGLAELFE